MTVFVPKNESSYALLDSGEGMKLERFGSVVLARPDPEALWKKHLPEDVWVQADGTFVRKGASGTWKAKKTLAKSWDFDFGGLTFELRPTSFKHVGIFPEQKEHWDWLAPKIKKGTKVLNLFAYTGGATLSAAKAGAEVVHVDSSKVAIEWAKKNAKLSNLAGVPIRYLEDDVLTFLKREVKRGNTYDVIIMDPPAFGHGSGTKLWKIERDFYELFDLALKVLSDSPAAFIVNGYTAGYSSITLKNNVQKIAEKYGGAVEAGELALAEEGTDRLLPSGVFARWSK